MADHGDSGTAERVYRDKGATVPSATASTDSPGWRRVFIIGGPGSGKTTLGARIAATLDAPNYELDVIGYENGAGPERSLAEKQSAVDAIAAKESWVVEGIFTGWTDPLAVAADVIIWLDVPWPVARHRIVLRHLKASLTRTNRHPGLRNLWRFVQNSRGYYTDQQEDFGRGHTARWLETVQVRVVTCRTDRDVSEVLQEVKRSPARP